MSDLQIDRLNVGELESDRQRWIDLGGVRFLIRLARPREIDGFWKNMRARGIVKWSGASDFDILDADRFRQEFARRFILDWSGNIEPEGTAYTVELGAKALGGILGLTERILREVTDYNAFLSSNGAGTT